MIAVDGFSSCGKSTFAREIAARLGYIFIDTGAMYRAVTLCGLRAGVVSPQGIDRAGLEALLDRIDISFPFNPARGASDIYVNGECVEREIRSIEVGGCVSAVSGVAEVRRRLVALQQAMGRDKGIVMDGRDIGTVDFPDAELKIFMTADPSVRARRRYDELRAKGERVTMEEVEENIRSRDIADQSRAISPLRRAEDAVVLDNSRMTVADQMEWVLGRLREMGVCE